jgi:hypothetical protein
MSDHSGGCRGGRFRIGLLTSLFLIILMGFYSPLAWGQITSGSLTGVVTDPSGAVVPGAKVVLTDVNKGYDYAATTDAVGRYLITNLPPSNYKLTVHNPGFMAFTQKGITLDVGTRLSVDVHLQLGATAQTVEVAATAPLMATQDAVTGQEVNRNLINGLPLYGRSVMDLAYLAPGVTSGIGVAYGPNQSPNDFVSNGGRNATNEILIDGVSATGNDPATTVVAVLYTPSVDAVQEFKLVQNNYSAEEGMSGNTYINMVMRSGTNSFHGSVYEYLRNQALNANNFFSNEAGGHLPAVRQNNYGLTFGGPIRKDKTFFFVDWEGFRTHSGTTASGGVPSAAMRQGNFAEICSSGFNSSGICQDANGANQLWDPYSDTYSAALGGRVASVPIPYNNLANFTSAGNPNLNGTGYQLAAVPGNLIDPVASKIMSYFPLPNVNVGNSSYTRFNNWTGSGITTGYFDKFDVRIDQRFTEKTSFSARVSMNQQGSHNWNCFGNALDPCTAGPGVTPARSVALILNHTFSPTMLLSLSFGFTRGLSSTESVNADFPGFNAITTLGEKAYMADSGFVTSPIIAISSGYVAVGPNSIGSQGWVHWKQAQEVWQTLPILTYMRGHHELKFGGEWRVLPVNYFKDTQPGGTFTFTQFANSQYVASGGGDAMAAFLTGIGIGGSGGYSITPYFASQNHRFAGFAQDNWRFNSKLTLNLGLRYDLEIPRTERYNHLWYFNPQLPVPMTVPAISPATWPSGLPYLPDVTHPTGALVNVTNADRHSVDTYYKDFGPRVGLAYKLTPNLVWRSGYGIFYEPTRFGAGGGANLGNTGWGAGTTWLPTYQGDGATPWSRLADPFPSGINIPQGGKLGPLTNIGMAMQEPARNMSLTPPYMQTWSGGFQYELPHGFLVDASYVGTKGTHLYYYMAGQLNLLGRWVEQEATNPALVTALNTMVPNPYYGVITTPGCSLCVTKLAANVLMTRYPYYNGAWNNFAALANSSYNAFQLRVEKRMANGLEVLATYTNSKSLDDSSVGTDKLDSAFVDARNPNVPQAERSLSEWDIPQVFQFAYLWQVPVGKGKRWGGNFNSVVNAFLGGWQTNGIWRFDDGQPLSIGLSGGKCPASYNCGFPNQTGPLQRNPKSLWLTQGYFANGSSVLSVPPNYVIGDAPREQPNIRRPGTSNASLSLFKEFNLNKMREGSHLEFRMEAFNALNHPQFGGIGATWNTGSFGSVTSQANLPRQVQLALKLYF